MRNRLSYFHLLLLVIIYSLFVSSFTSLSAQGGYFEPNFQNTEIKDFLKTMAQITRKNILIDDGVRGKITIVQYKRIPVSRAVDFLKQVLEVKGYGVIEDRHLIRIVKTKEAGEATIPQDRDPTDGSSGMVSRVITLPVDTKVNRLVGLLRNIVGNKNATVVAYPPTNSLVITGQAQHVRRALSVLDKLGVRGETGEETGPKSSGDLSGVHIYRVKNLAADSLAQVLVRLDNPQFQRAAPAAKGGAKGAKNVPKPVTTPGRPGARPTKIKAVAHKESNSLVVTAKPEEWEEIKTIIERLDKVRKQLLLEVLIVEVSSDDLNDFGIDWRYLGRSGPHTQFNSGRVVEGGLINTETGAITGNNTLSGFSLGFLEKGGELLGIFNANIKNQNFNVLSAPQILTLDNQEAEINVGQDVPVRKQERTSGGGSSEATVNSFDYRPAGIKLKFTPHINPEGVVGLDLFQEITNIEGGVTTAANPVFSKRNVKTYVTVKDKQTIVIGGLVSNTKQHTVSKIPLLGDIPLLGFIFRRTTYSNKKTNLMIFLTPHILDDPATAQRISTYKRAEQIRSMRERANQLKLWPESDSPEKRDDFGDKREQIDFSN